MSVETARLPDPSLHSGTVRIPLTQTEREAVKNEFMPVARDYAGRILAEYQKKAQNDVKIAEADRKINEAQKGIDEAEKRNREIIASVFLGIFGIKQKPTPEQADDIFAKYSLDTAIIKGDEAFILSSMEGVVRYLSEHPQIDKCNIRMFKKYVREVKPLTDYLSKPDCKVKAMGISSAIDTESQALFRLAAQAREGSLTVFCQ